MSHLKLVNTTALRELPRAFLSTTNTNMTKQQLLGLTKALPWMRRGLPSTCAFHSSAARSTAMVSDDPVEVSKARPLKHMPGPSLFSVQSDLTFTNKYKGKRHIYFEDKMNQYGRVFRMRLGPSHAICLGDPDIVEGIFRREGQLPARIIVDTWRAVRDKLGWSRGVFTQDGPDWKRWRKTLDQQMMKPTTVAHYADGLNDVTSDFLSRLRKVRDANGVDKPVPNIRHEFFHWSLESIGTVVLERRFGCFEDKVNPQLEKFINGVVTIFEASDQILEYPYKLARIINRKACDRMEQGFKDSLEVGKIMIDEKMAEIQKVLDRGEAPSGFLSKLMATKSMSPAELYGNAIELLAGAVDTTSTTMQWALYLLSRHPEVQHRLHDEVNAVVPSKQIPSYSDLQKMPYLKAIFKETARLFPAVFAVSRYLENDMNINGYKAPKGTLAVFMLYSMGRDNQLFEEAEKFKPERWLREGSHKHTSTFASIPFGFGTRMCVGRRVAELELHLLMARLAQEFIIEAGTTEEIEAISAGVLQSKDQIKIILKDRI